MSFGVGNFGQQQFRALYELRNAKNSGKSLKIDDQKDEALKKALTEIEKSLNPDNKNVKVDGTLTSKELDLAIKDLEAQFLDQLKDLNKDGKKGKLDLLDIAEFISKTSEFEGSLDGAKGVSSKEKAYWQHLQKLATDEVNKDKDKKDVNGDGKVDAEDYDKLTAAYGELKNIRSTTLDTLYKSVKNLQLNSIKECKTKKDAITHIAVKLGVSKDEAEKLLDLYSQASDKKEVDKLNEKYTNYKKAKDEYETIPKDWRNAHDSYLTEKANYDKINSDLKTAKSASPKDEAKIANLEKQLKEAKAKKDKAEKKRNDLTEYYKYKGGTGVDNSVNSYVQIAESYTKAKNSYESEIKKTYGDDIKDMDTFRKNVSKIFANKSHFATAIKNKASWK